MKRNNDKKKIENFANSAVGLGVGITVAVLVIIVIIYFLVKGKKGSIFGKTTDPAAALLDSATSSAVPYLLTNTL